MYKYFMWTDLRPYYDDKTREWITPMKGGELLDYTQIQSLLHCLNPRQEGHATILDYDSSGRVLGCPLYFDIDMPSLIDAYYEMQSLVTELRYAYEIEPAVFFSGSKGFHVVMPLFIKHERCYEVAKYMAYKFSNEIDTQVYRTRAMMRCTNTMNTKSGDQAWYKVRVSPDDDLETIKRQAKAKQTSAPVVYQQCDKFDADVAKVVAKLPPIKIQSEFEVDSTMSPCIQRMWKLKTYDEGQRHYIIFIFVRQFYRMDKTEQDVIELFENHSFWKHYPQREYMKIINSVYRSGKAYLGCHNGRDGEILRTYCVTLCGYNRDFSIGDVFK